MTEFIKYITNDAAAFTVTILLLWMFNTSQSNSRPTITLTIKNQDKEGE